jgi:hypothetical protein
MSIYQKQGTTFFKQAYVNGDGSIALPEVMYILQICAGIR